MVDRPFQTCALGPLIGLGLVLILCILAGTRPSYAQNEENSFQVAVLVSKHIKPYMEAATGLEAYLQDLGGAAQIILLEDRDSLQREQLARRLQSQSYHAAVSMGPQATGFLWGLPELNIPTLFSMVLHPEQAVGDSGKRLCGVSLSIPVDIQLQSIEQFLPGRTHIGLLFQPDNNQSIFHQAQRIARDLDIEVIPMPLESQRDVSRVLKEHLDQVDAVWLIPDQTLNSKKVVEYIIKQALYAEVPVIGYNRFFHESGAAVSFIFDYGLVGRQTGRLLKRSMDFGWCEVRPAEFKVWKNERIFELLDLEDE